MNLSNNVSKRKEKKQCIAGKFLTFRPGKKWPDLGILDPEEHLPN
jgi:hypothetical protein